MEMLQVNGSTEKLITIVYMSYEMKKKLLEINFESS